MSILNYLNPFGKPEAADGRDGAVSVYNKDVGGSVNFGEGGILTLSSSDNATTESDAIETEGDYLYVWTTSACQIVVGDKVTADETHPVLIPNTPFKLAFQSGWRISVRAIGTSGGFVYFHPVGGY